MLDVLRYSSEVLRDSRFIFQDNGLGGLKCEIHYKEPRNKMASFTTKQQPIVIMESFEISRAQLLEMRRLYACNLVKKYNTTEFNVLNLMNVVNKIVAKSDIFTYLMIDNSAMEPSKKQEADKKESDSLNKSGKGRAAAQGTASGDEEDIADDDAAKEEKRKSSVKAKAKAKDKMKSVISNISVIKQMQKTVAGKKGKKTK